MPDVKNPSPTLNLVLWIVQGLLAVMYIGTAFWKVLTPIPTLAGMIPWAGQVAPAFLYFTGLADLAGGLGLILPDATRILPRLTVAAAVGTVALQVSAIVFHFSRGEYGNTPFNFFLVGAGLFVAWGRLVKAPITPR